METIAVVILTFALVSYKPAGDSTSSYAASEAATLTVTFHGSENPDPGVYQPSFYKQCITAEVSNSASTDASFIIDEGTLLTPDNPDLQRMMVTKEEHIIIKPHSNQKIKLYAMCTQADNGGPVPKTRFVVSGVAPGSWVSLANLISRHHYQDLAGQAALWVLTDNHPVGDIKGADVNEVQVLKNYVAKLKQQPGDNTLLPTQDNWAPGQSKRVIMESDEE